MLLWLKWFPLPDRRREPDAESAMNPTYRAVEHRLGSVDLDGHDDHLFAVFVGTVDQFLLYLLQILMYSSLTFKFYPSCTPLEKHTPDKRSQHESRLLPPNFLTAIIESYVSSQITFRVLMVWANKLRDTTSPPASMSKSPKRSNAAWSPHQLISCRVSCSESSLRCNA